MSGRTTSKADSMFQDSMYLIIASAVSHKNMKEVFKVTGMA